MTREDDNPRLGQLNPAAGHDRIRFSFELDPIVDVPGWGEPGQKRLHWFGLTSGRYSIETPIGEVLRYTPEIQALWNCSARVDYYIARLFEDVQHCLPNAFEAVPEDIARIVSDHRWMARAAEWCRLADSDYEERWDLYESALRWWSDREIDTAYLRAGPTISFWRVKDESYVRWTTNVNEDQGLPIFVTGEGTCAVGAKQFEAAAYGFCDAVLSQMRERIEHIQRHGWQRTDCALNLEELVAEQQRREQTFNDLRGLVAQTDWALVRSSLSLLSSKIDM